MKQNEDITLALYQISNAVNTTSDLNELYEKIHQSLGRIVDTGNFYIALYDAKEGYIHFPYFVDKRSKTKSGGGYYAEDRKASMTLRVIKSGQPILINKKESIEYCKSLNSEPSGPIAEMWIGVPLKVKSEVIGVVAVQSYTDPNRYSSHDVNILNSVSDQIALAIERKRSEEALRDREQLISVLYKLSNAMHTTENLEQYFGIIHDSLNNIINAKNFTIALYDSKRDTLFFRYSTDVMDKTMMNPVENASQTSSLSYQVIKAQKTLLLSEQEKAELYESLNGKMIGDVSAKTWLGVPLIGKSEILGVVIIQSYDELDCYDKKEVNLLEAVSDQIAFAIEYKRAQEELEQVQKELIQKAHKAGMTDIASDTLHNIGNVLNSVNTSTNIIRDIVANSAVRGLNKALNLLKCNKDNFKEFIANDPKGERLVNYLLSIEEPIHEEYHEILKQSDRLMEKVSLMTNVIRAQQAYASGGFMEETIQLETVVENTLNLHASSLKSSGITIRKNYEKIPRITVQRTKLSHVLMNLIINAKDAMEVNENNEKILDISIDQNERHVFLTVSDTGKGIEEKDLKKIFNHGFTTKKQGHGFGLHNSANFMSEMKGAIWAKSEGPGKGASFVLRFNK
ncbi:MAG: GAF domain-containing sensor histidine kinase [Proteobacteria bacterium]|nr:GAF domain-containing sensor histidine kinase [Pseudomonadota bacterium]